MKIQYDSKADALNRAWSEVSTQMYQQAGPQGGPGGEPGGNGHQPPPDGQAGPKVENADFEVVDDEKK